MTTEPFDPLFKKHFGKIEVVANGYVYPADIIEYRATEGKYEVRIALPNGHYHTMTLEARRVRAPRSYAAAYDQPVVSEEFLKDLAEKKAEKKKENIGFPKPKFQINAPVRYMDTMGTAHDAFVVGWSYQRMSNPERFEYFYSLRIPNVSTGGIVLGNHQVGNVCEGALSAPVATVKPDAKFAIGDKVLWSAANGLRKHKVVIKSLKYHPVAEDWRYEIEMLGEQKGMYTGVSGFNNIPEKDLAKIEKTEEKKEPKFKPGQRVAFTENSANYGATATVLREDPKFPRFWELELDDDSHKELSTHQDFIELAMVEETKDPYQAIIDEAREKLAPFLEAVGEMQGNVDFKRIGQGMGQIVEFFGGMANFDPEEGKKKNKKDESK